MRYVIMAMPRSRTAWLASYLTACGALTRHEGLLGYRTVADAMTGLSMWHQRMSSPGLRREVGPYGMTDTMAPGLVEDIVDQGARVIAIEGDRRRAIEFGISLGVGVRQAKNIADRFYRALPFAVAKFQTRELDNPTVMAGLFDAIGHDFTSSCRERLDEWKGLRITADLRHVERQVATFNTECLAMLARADELDQAAMRAASSSVSSLKAGPR